MKDIETLGIRLFDEHSHRKDGRYYDWNYLSRDRQIEWMKEAFYNVSFAINELLGKIKPPQGSDPKDASYWMGFKAGQHSKHIECTNIYQDLHKKLHDQLIDIITEHRNKR